MMAGEQAEVAQLGSAPVATLIGSEQGKAGLAQGLAQALVAPGMLGHAMGQQHHGLYRFGRQPLVYVQAAVLTGGQPEGVVGHGGSLCAQLPEQCMHNRPDCRRGTNKIHNVNGGTWRICTLGLPANVESTPFRQQAVR